MGQSYGGRRIAATVRQMAANAVTPVNPGINVYIYCFGFNLDRNPKRLGRREPRQIPLPGPRNQNQELARYGRYLAKYFDGSEPHIRDSAFNCLHCRRAMDHRGWCSPRLHAHLALRQYAHLAPRQSGHLALRQSAHLALGQDPDLALRQQEQTPQSGAQVAEQRDARSHAAPEAVECQVLVR